MSKEIARILLHGPQQKLKLFTRIWIESEIENILIRAKEDFSEVYLYSGLDMGIELLGAKVALKISIPVIGCIPYEEFTHKFLPSELALYRAIRKNIYHLKIIGKTPDYVAYRKRTLYLTHQTNKLLFVWDEKQNTAEHFFYGTISSKWKGTGRVVFHLNPEIRKVNSFQL